MCIGSFSYTRSRLASLARFLFVGQSDVRLRSLLQGTRVTYVTETFVLLTVNFTFETQGKSNSGAPFVCAQRCDGDLNKNTDFQTIQT